MGTGDKTDPTTTFFDDHREQCIRYAAKLRGVVGAESLVAKMDAAVAASDVAIAKGRLRTDMPPIVAAMPAIVTDYKALPAKTKDDFQASVRADMGKPAQQQGAKP